jgi:hypothetical protein
MIDSDEARAVSLQVRIHRLHGLTARASSFYDAA